MTVLGTSDKVLSVEQAESVSHLDSKSYGLISTVTGDKCGLWFAHFLLGVKSIKKTEINEEIRDREIRLIGQNGEQLGIMSSSQALDMAIDAKLDLVKIAPTARPPVCKIMDYGKFKYEQTKLEKEQKKKQKVIQVKEIRLSVTIDDNDLNTKAKHAIKFLEDGDRLKVALRYRGRQLGRKEQGVEVVERFSEIIKDHGSLDRPPQVDGRSLIAFYSPKK